MPQVDGKQPSFPAFSGGVSLLLSHPGWGHRLRRSYKLKYRRIESEQTVKNRALRLSPSKTKQTKEKNLFHIGKFMSENWLKLMEKNKIFLHFWVVFPSSFLIRAGDRLRLSYKQTTIGEYQTCKIEYSWPNLKNDLTWKNWHFNFAVRLTHGNLKGKKVAEWKIDSKNEWRFCKTRIWCGYININISTLTHFLAFANNAYQHQFIFGTT